MNDFKQYANSFQTVINLGLSRIELLLSLLGNPQDSLRYIHVAGTNAKGSVCAFMQSALTHSGIVTGKYTSPNLIRVNERITVDGEEINNSDLNDYLETIEEKAAEVKKRLGEHPTQFEIWTALAFLYFKDKKCGVVILETGLGGRFDATNVIKHSEIAVITRIALDHTEYLGDTLDKIAFEKCGIIKKNSSVVTVVQEQQAQAVINARAAEEQSRLYTVAVPEITDKKEIYEKYGDIYLSLGGIHQLENAALAKKALEVFGISEESICFGLTHAVNNARFELIGKNPPVIFDGGHNPNGIASLKKSLQRYFPNEKKIFICAFMKDKDIDGSLAILKSMAEEICFVPVVGNSRCAGREQLMTAAKKAGINARFYESAATAIRYATKKNMLTVICGSLYLYKDITIKKL